MSIVHTCTYTIQIKGLGLHLIKHGTIGTKYVNVTRDIHNLPSNSTSTLTKDGAYAGAVILWICSELLLVVTKLVCYC